MSWAMARPNSMGCSSRYTPKTILSLKGKSVAVTTVGMEASMEMISRERPHTSKAVPSEMKCTTRGSFDTT